MSAFEAIGLFVVVLATGIGIAINCILASVGAVVVYQTFTRGKEDTLRDIRIARRVGDTVRDLEAL